MISRILLFVLICFNTEDSLADPLVVEWIPSSSTVADDYDSVKYPVQGSEGITQWSLSGRVPSTGKKYTIHVGSISYGLPDTFSFQLPQGGCCHNAKVSVTANASDCLYATNAGYFNTTDDCCVGNLIINSAIIQLTSIKRVSIGLSHDGYVMGYLENTTIINMKLLQLISGFGWLVRKGVPYVNTSRTKEGMSDYYVNEKAPRTAVVIHENGTLSLMQVDGEEDISAGLDLFEFSEILTNFGAWHAINLDGGGSSVSVFNNKVISKPTCIDIHLICERKVSSIACMKQTGKK